MPGGGDAAKVVQSLPAVARPSAGSTEIVVWGAAPNETRVFVDGVPVPALYHLGGYRSAVGNDLIGDIHLAPAAFGVDRGRAIGGVIDIGLADPAKRARRGACRPTCSTRSVEGQARSSARRRSPPPCARAGSIARSALVEDPQQLAPNAPLPRWTDAQLVARAPLADDLVLTAWVLGSIDTLDRALVVRRSGDADRRARRSAHACARRSPLRRDRADGYDSGTLWFGRDRTRDDSRVRH